MSKILQLKNVTKAYNCRTVVNVDELNLGEYGIEGLIGPNGAGKSTLISLITHRVHMDSGSMIYSPAGQEIDITKKSLDAIARMGIVRTNQLIQDFENLTIRDSMLLALANSSHEQFYKLGSEKKLVASATEEIEKYLDYFHFDDPLGHALSAGEKKLLDIIRCLLLKPRFLLMDEPTAGLAQDQREKVIKLMRKKVDEEGMNILIVEHDLDLIWSVCDHIHFMAEGQVLFHGTPDEIRQNEIVIKKYVGDSDAEN